MPAPPQPAVAEDDVDDLDDLLDDFTAQPPAPAAAPAPATSFEDELSRNMAALLSPLGDEDPGDDDAHELQTLLAQLMGGDGGGDGEQSLDALLASLGGGIPTKQNPSSAPAIPASSTPAPASAPTSAPAAAASTPKPLSFEETIKQTMSNMKASEHESRNAGDRSEQDPLAALLASLNIDPNDLSSLNIPGDAAPGAAEGDFGGLLDGMMKQLMTKEILEEPLLELAEKYPPYLASHRPPTIPTTQYDTYVAQNTIVQRIVQIFGKEGYSDDDSTMRGQVMSLMTQMQDLGSPPDEIMGEMPEGLDFAGDGCTIM